MAFDGLFTRAMVRELQEALTLGKIDKIYQPLEDELILNIHTKNGNKKLYASVNPAHSSLYIMEGKAENPVTPFNFCMLLRKHLLGGRISEIRQVGYDRIVEIYIETLNELGFNVSKKLIFEIMGKHSNIVLLDANSQKVLDSIKRVSIDVNRIRQILPGIIYKYPPSQDKIDFHMTEDQLDDIISKSHSSKDILSTIGGISPAVADKLYISSDFPQEKADYINAISGLYVPQIFYNDGIPKDFHIMPLPYFDSFEDGFSSISNCLEKYFSLRTASNRIKQKSHDLTKHLRVLLDKAYLKDQRLKEDIVKAKKDKEKKLLGELITANLHLIKHGDKSIEVLNYYTGEYITIALDSRVSPSKNAQNYYRDYNKSKTAIVEKSLQIEENQREIDYLESVLTHLNNAEDEATVEEIRQELMASGFVKKRKSKEISRKIKTSPIKYISSDGFEILVGRNNQQNDKITMQLAQKTDIWLHTKDIPGSHVIIRSNGKDIPENTLLEAAQIAAYHSKARESENVPVDYVPIKNIRKPAQAKLGMVIFTGNKTVWVNPDVTDKKRLD